MFADISIINFLIYAAGIGFAAAIIYTNIQRTALSKFINQLIDNNCLDEGSAASLDKIGLTSLQKKIVKTAVKNQYGFKRSITSISDGNKSGADEFFVNVDTNRYYISDTDTEALKKKYSYKTMKTSLVILFVAALAVVVIVTSLVTSYLIDVLSKPKTEPDNMKDDTVQSEQRDDENTPSEDDYVQENTEENTENGQNDIITEKPQGPRIPT